MQTDADIIKKYQQALTQIKALKEKEIKRLNESKDGLITELEIATRVGHKVEEEYIRYKIEVTIDSIDAFKQIDFKSLK